MTVIFTKGHLANYEVNYSYNHDTARFPKQPVAFSIYALPGFV